MWASSVVENFINFFTYEVADSRLHPRDLYV